MMMNLFSIFDPSTSTNFSLNWMTLIIIPLIFIPISYWVTYSRMQMIYFLTYNYLYNEFKILIKNSNKNNLIMFISMMMFIMLNNLIGLFPYIFTSTSHLTISLSMSLILWISFMIYGYYNYPTSMFTHLVPLGTPSILMPFMVLIETISNIIRPMTLAIRLSANMIAGHLLLTLIGQSCENSFLLLIMVIIFAQNMLMILELSVAMIQSYVMTTLSLLYSNEIYE